eukprot:m.241907 g.241907  ORF g.241907 m.241907 type:complete len:64 (+) comp40208_c0_seq71:3956-4147(+)
MFGLSFVPGLPILYSVFICKIPSISLACWWFMNDLDDQPFYSVEQCQLSHSCKATTIPIDDMT